MLGAIVGDVIGSSREFNPVKAKDFALFEEASSYTDDTVMTCAVAKAILEGKDYGAAMHELGVHYPDSGYGGRFFNWMFGDLQGPYGSFGNGSAMRVSPVAWAFETEVEVLREARASALPTHDHPEGIKGAEATALAIFLARKGASKADIRKEIEGRFGYDLSRRLDDIRPGYGFNETCQGTVPEAIISFLESWSVEDTIRNAVSLGGDADTLAAIAGPIAEAYYGRIPGKFLRPALGRLDERLYAVVDDFIDRFRPAEAPRIRSLRQEYLSGAEDPVDLVDIDEVELREEWRRIRDDMVGRGSWYEAEGSFKGARTGSQAPRFTKVEGRKLLALGRSDFYVPFLESLSRAFAERVYQSDFMAWIEPGNAYESLLFYIATAERIDFSLEGVGAEDLRRATSASGGPKRNRGDLGLRYMTSWEANQVYWGEALGKTWWHLRGGMSREEAAAAFGGRVHMDRIVVGQSTEGSSS